MSDPEPIGCASCGETVMPIILDASKSGTALKCPNCGETDWGPNP